MAKKRILVVDDEPLIVKALKYGLECSGYEVIAAFNETQAISEVRSEKPDLILLDMNIPGSNSIGIFGTLRASSNISSIPVIFMTDLRNEERKKKVLEMGAKDIIYKPFVKNDLLAQIKKALGES